MEVPKIKLPIGDKYWPCNYTICNYNAFQTVNYFIIPHQNKCKINLLIKKIFEIIAKLMGILLWIIIKNNKTISIKPPSYKIVTK